MKAHECLTSPVNSAECGPRGGTDQSNRSTSLMFLPSSMSVATSSDGRNTDNNARTLRSGPPLVRDRDVRFRDRRACRAGCRWMGGSGLWFWRDRLGSSGLGMGLSVRLDRLQLVPACEPFDLAGVAML